MRIWVIGSLLLSLCLFEACSQPAEGPTPQAPLLGQSEPLELSWDNGVRPSYAERSRPDAGVDYVKIPGEPMLPAYRSRLKALKGDEYDDIRALNPERFALTAPPKLGVRPMVEWEPMRSVILSVPAYMAQYSNAWATLASIGFHASKVAEVWYIVSADSVATNLTDTLLTMGLDVTSIGGKVKFLVAPLDSVWFIDSGPLPIVDPQSETFAFLDFRYYNDRPFDDGNPSWLGRQASALGLSSPVNTYRPGLSTEGGTFQATEDGLCITGNRQIYHMSCAEPGGCDQSIRTMPLDEVQEHPLTLKIEEIWRDYAGCVDTVVTNSISDDGTGHIDMYLKVLDTQRVLIGYYEPPFEGQAEVNAQRLDDNAEFLSSYVKPDGTTFTVERIKMPGHRSVQNGSQTNAMPFTYINSTFINGLNLWPAFTFPEWEESRATAEAEWQAVLPEMEHIWIDSEELSFWSGAIHCVTRTVPALTPSAWVADGECGECGECDAPEGGYDGLCQPGASSEDVCYGPEWLCGCNDCTSPCPGGPSGLEPASDPCFGISQGGCCNASGDLVICDGAALETLDCLDQGCGWSEAAGWFDCGHEGEDPSGEATLSCQEIRDTYLACEPQCEGRECGDDGCGGSCGGCGECDMCSDGLCVPACADECAEGESGCEGAQQWTCERGASGCAERVTTDCGLSGLVCEGGVCVAATAEGAQGDDLGDNAGGDAGALGRDAPERDMGGESPSEGCAGGLGHEPPRGIMLLLVGILCAALRRWPRAGHLA